MRNVFQVLASNCHLFQGKIAGGLEKRGLGPLLNGIAFVNLTERVAIISSRSEARSGKQDF